MNRDSKTIKMLSLPFQGEFLEGLMHGQGCYMWSDGVKYEVSTSFFSIQDLFSTYSTLKCVEVIMLPWCFYNGYFII